MPEHHKHIVQILIRHATPASGGGVAFLLHPVEKWHTSEGRPFLALPTTTLVDDVPDPFKRGVSLEVFVDHLMQDKLKLAGEHYVLEDEIEPVVVDMPQSSTGEPAHYTDYAVDVWVSLDQREAVRQAVGGQWLTLEEINQHADVPPTVHTMSRVLHHREEQILAERAKPKAPPEFREKPNQRPPGTADWRIAERRLMLDRVPDQPTMDGLARKWFALNKAGVRVLTKQCLGEILDAGNRAFNLRVADPYLRYQQQGLGFTWSFFTHKDKQDTHVHGAPVVEIYGVLQGRMEIWFKPYFDRGTSAWSHKVLEPGDWAEVEPLQCHIVHWLTEGQGVVFKAGPGPLAEVGKLGVKGKTPCENCPCMKPEAVRELERGK